MHPEQGDKLYVLITTDHGMDTIKTLVNLKRLMGRADVPAPDPVRADWAGSLANIYLNDVPGADREATKKAILESLSKASYLKCWTRENLPEQFAYANPARTGDIVVSLDPGYYFTKNDVAEPVPAESDPRSLKGMHGYDPAVDDKMQGFMVLARYGSDQPGHDLGKIDTLHIHPTVAKLLGIKPADGAKKLRSNRSHKHGRRNSRRYFLALRAAFFFFLAAAAAGLDFAFDTATGLDLPFDFEPVARVFVVAPVYAFFCVLPKACSQPLEYFCVAPVRMTVIFSP